MLLLSRKSVLLLGSALALVIASTSSHSAGLRERLAARSDEAASAAGLVKQSIQAQGVQREFFLYRPSGSPPAGGWPLVIALHGGQGNGQQMADQTGFNDVASRYRFMVAYPNSVKYWNDGRQDTASNVNDVAFIAQLIDHLVRTAQANAKRVYVTGISNGGMMTYRLACELNDRITGFAPVAASFPVDYFRNCKPNRAVPIMIFNSPDDGFMPWNGGEIRHSEKRGVGGNVIPVSDSVDFWKAQNRCSASRLAQTIDNNRADGTAVKVYDFANCAAPMQFLVIEGGGHVWPGITSEGVIQRRLVGKSTEEIKGSEVIWQYLSPLSR